MGPAPPWLSFLLMMVAGWDLERGAHLNLRGALDSAWGLHAWRDWLRSVICVARSQGQRHSSRLRGILLYVLSSGIGGAMRSKVSPAARTSATGTSMAMNCPSAATVAFIRTTACPYWTTYVSGTARYWKPTRRSSVLAKMSKGFQLSVVRMSS